MKNRLLILLCLFCTTACNGVKEQGQAEIKNEDVHLIQVDLKEQDIHTSNLFSDCTPVKLETNDLSLLKEISKSYLTKNHIFIKSNHSLFIFNREGRFLRKIDKMGNGPEEYARLSDFDVDEEMNHIYILANQKIVVYNFQGEYQDSYPIGIGAIKLIKDDQDQFCLYSGNEVSESNSHKLNIWDKSTFKTSFLEIDDMKKTYLHINSAQNFYWKDGMPFFYEAFNDTIYSVEKKGPVYYIQYKHSVPPSFFENKFDNIMEFFQKYNQMGYTNSTYDVFESDHKLFFSCYDKGSKYFNVYFKDKEQCESYNNIIDDLLFRNCAIPFSEDDFEFWTNRDGEIIYYISPQFVKENAGDIINDTYQEFANKLTEDDNPIAIICKLKN